MKLFPTPDGKAGTDHIDAMIESAQSELEQMYGQLAKLKTLEYGVGRAVATSDFGDSKVRFLSQKRECEAQVCFHGGRALELALNVVHARATDRILGRDYSGAPDTVGKERRGGHAVKKIYDLIVEESSDKDVEGALEDVYQQVLHAGINEVHLDDRLIWSFFHREDCPFRETVSGGWYAGAETTQDNVGERDSLFGPIDLSQTDFSKMNCETLPEFLGKADVTYYEIEGRRRDLRWANYASRDHQHGRPYVVIGTDFFARLVAKIIALSSNWQWTWHPDFRERWHRRHQANIADRIDGLLNQNYSGKANLPEMNTTDESIKFWSMKHASYPDDYSHLHKKTHRVSIKECPVR